MSTHPLRMVYVSQSTALLTADVLHAIYKAARARNEERGVTGVLCAWQGYFIQVLEGHQLDVLGIYASILKGKAHGCDAAQHLAGISKSISQFVKGAYRWE